MDCLFAKSMKYYCNLLKTKKYAKFVKPLMNRAINGRVNYIKVLK